MDTRRYGSQLRALADCSRSRKVVILECLRGTSTPLKPDVWRKELLKHPDWEFVEMILRGITEGFAGAPDSQECEHNSTIMHETCEEVAPLQNPKRMSVPPLQSLF